MPDALFLVELGGVTLLLAVLSRIAVRFGFSPIPLYLFAGLAFGDGGVAPLVTAEGFIEAGAEIGLILLLSRWAWSTRRANSWMLFARQRPPVHSTPSSTRRRDSRSG